jgi:hypothetical protein
LPDPSQVPNYRAPGLGSAPRRPNWLDLYPDRFATTLLGLEICALVTVHFTRNSTQERAMCILLSGVVWAPLGALASIDQMIELRSDRKAPALTALCVYVGIAVAMVAILKDPTLLGVPNYAEFFD